MSVNQERVGGPTAVRDVCDASGRRYRNGDYLGIAPSGFTNDAGTAAWSVYALPQLVPYRQRLVQIPRQMYPLRDE